jgi:multidrug efflux pump subunit AcrB
MTFLEFPIKRYQFTLVAFAMLVALGISSFLSIPRQEDPYFPIPIYQIASASWTTSRRSSRSAMTAWRCC